MSNRRITYVLGDGTETVFWPTLLIRRRPLDAD